MENPSQLSFLEHLDELRTRLIKSIIAVVICSAMAYHFIDQFLEIMIRPVGKLVFTSPSEAFLARMILTILSGVAIAIPVIFYQIWKFVASAMTKKERRCISIFAPFSLISFIVGAAFAYFIMLPIAMKFLLSFSSALIVPMITVSKYISFVGTLVLAGGIIFELPLVILFLTKIGIATPEFLRQKRKFAVVIIFAVSAVITPPDVFTQLLMAVPLIVLYELGIIISQWAAPNDEKV